MISEYLSVGVGGFAGSVCRYGVGQLMTQYFGKHPIWGTFSVNVLGCFIIGIIGGFAEEKGWINGPVKLLLMTGFLGGFTTFSSFGHETIRLMQQTQYGPAMLYVGLSLGLGLLAAFAGFKLSVVLV